MVRKIVQIAAAVIQNGYLLGFLSGSLYGGGLKRLCAPGLNCHSCPGALFACPIGALQALAANPRLQVSLYVYGFVALIGALSGRFVCGFLCPFGLLQELLHKIPLKKIRERRVFKTLDKLKYAVLAVLVIGVPTFVALGGGIGFPAFCQWLCPAGTLEAGVPLTLLNERIRGAAGLLLLWKGSLLVLTLWLSIKMFRPFCRFLCPLGALYSLFNRVSLIRIRTDKSVCDACGTCAATCPMRAESADSAECVRCGKCVKSCPKGALRLSLKGDCAAEREKSLEKLH
ncbi:MAG: 4Fe-4S binding protein [Clostridiales Family XIII bacterium]|nr:4Fe-4S binding protein [Clostridiales Family XIII bacterium]